MPRTPSTSTGTSSPSSTSSSRSAVPPGVLRPPRVRLRRRGRRRCLAPPTPRRPWARYRERSLCRSCSVSGTLVREDVRREQPFEKVVVAAVAVASREAEHAGDGVRLEHRAHGVRRHSEPVGHRPALALEVECRQRAVRADPLEHALGHLGVLGEDARRVPAQRAAEPREVARRDEGESLVVRLEDLAPLVEQVAPRRVVVGDARVQDEVVGATGDRERIELDRAERRKTSSTASGPASSERAGASAWRATRKRRAASPVTLTAGDARVATERYRQRHRLATEPYSLS